MRKKKLTPRSLTSWPRRKHFVKQYFEKTVIPNLLPRCKRFLNTHDLLNMQLNMEIQTLATMIIKGMCTSYLGQYKVLKKRDY